MSFMPKSVFLTLISTSFSSMIFAAAPPGAGINYLEVRTASDGAQSGIYANGQMQAALKITFELAEGYNFQSVKLRTRDDELGKHWKVTESENEFEHNILSRDIADFNYSNNDRVLSLIDEDVQQIADDVKQLPSLENNRLRVFRYVTASMMDEARVCVELTAKNANNEPSIKSTCVDNTTASGMYVHVIAQQEKKYTINDFNVHESKFGWQSISAGKGSYNYAMTYTYIIPKYQGLQLRKITVDDKIPNEKGFSTTIATQTPQYYKMSGQTQSQYIDSKLDLIPIKQGSKREHGFHYKYSINEPVGTTSVYSNYGNDDNLITLLTLYGSSWGSRGGYAKLPGQTRIEPKSVKFYDIYGNNGEIKVRRVSAWDGAPNDRGYEVY
ncbi:hypothetical protein NM099_003542 [Vibrio cholerae]|nr:hypothetical protein [Vibrio cholerae]